MSQVGSKHYADIKRLEIHVTYHSVVEIVSKAPRC